MSKQENFIEAPFWKRKTLAEMSQEEWESLCDGCGRCCMLKLEDEDDGQIYLTRLACKMLDLGKCRCKDYENRHTRVPDCLSFDEKMVRELSWLPGSCAYRMINEGRELAWWHPLVSGDPDTVHAAGISVRDWAIAESPAKARALHKYLVLIEE